VRPPALRLPRRARDRGRRPARGDRAAIAARHSDLDVPGAAPSSLRRVRVERGHGDGSDDGARVRALVRRRDGGGDVDRLEALVRQARRRHRGSATARRRRALVSRDPASRPGIQWPGFAAPTPSGRSNAASSVGRDCRRSSQ